MRERNGVRWQYLTEGTANQQTSHHGIEIKHCEDCRQYFVASCHRAKGDQAWCPECRPVKSLRASVRDAHDRIESQATEITVGDLVASGEAQ